jgi:hypothetical protein
MFSFSLKLLSKTFLILRTTERDVKKMYIGRYVKHPLFLSGFNELNFLDKFSKNTRISNFIKIRLVGAEVFHTDIQTDRPGESNCRAPTVTQLKRLGVPLLYIFARAAQVPDHNNGRGPLKVGHFRLEI